VKKTRGFMGKRARVHRDLDVYAKAFEQAMEVFALSKKFPREEVYSLTDQMHRSSRAVCANIAEAWRKRRYVAAFISKLSDAEAEAAETQVWLEFAVRCAYLPRDRAAGIYRQYDRIIATLVGMITYPRTWVIPKSPSDEATARGGNMRG
jgi:four helix bundle protein